MRQRPDFVVELEPGQRIGISFEHEYKTEYLDAKGKTLVKPITKHVATTCYVQDVPRGWQPGDDTDLGIKAVAIVRPYFKDNKSKAEGRRNALASALFKLFPGWEQNEHSLENRRATGKSMKGVGLPPKILNRNRAYRTKVWAAYKEFIETAKRRSNEPPKAVNGETLH